MVDEKLNEISSHITNEELLKDLTDHYELLKKFREKHIIQEDEDAKVNGNDEEEEREDDDRRDKENPEIKKEKMDLIGIEENTSDETQNLAYHKRYFTTPSI